MEAVSQLVEYAIPQWHWLPFYIEFLSHPLSQHVSLKASSGADSNKAQTKGVCILSHTL